VYFAYSVVLCVTFTCFCLFILCNICVDKNMFHIHIFNFIFFKYAKFVLCTLAYMPQTGAYRLVISPSYILKLFLVISLLCYYESCSFMPVIQ